jgi:hypothetical protein
MKVVARVQSHPSRRGIRERLMPSLEGLAPEVIETDFDPPNPWYGYLECLRDPPADATHLLIVQDDTVACTNLTPALHRLAELPEGEVPICLYLGGVPTRTRGEALRAGKRGDRFVDIHPGDFMPVVAVLWPVEKAREFHAWGSDPTTLRHKNGRPFVERSDDAMGGRWMRRTMNRAVATIPSFIEHPDDVISTIARTNSGRTALFWHGEGWDALNFFA